MPKNFSKALSNINCIDLLNNSWEDIHNYCLLSNVANGFKMYLKHLHTNLHDNLLNTTNPHLVFFDCDYIIGSIRNNHKIEKFSLGGMEILPDVNHIKIDLSMFKKCENEIANTKNLELNLELLEKLKPIILKNYNTDFVQMHIEVINELAIPFPQFSKAYHQNIVFLNCENDPDLDSLILNKIFYRYGQAVIFVFKNASGLEYMGWNRDFLLQIRNIKPIKFQKVDNKIKLNAVLDKINDIGITRLDVEELAFLNSFSNNKV